MSSRPILKKGSRGPAVKELQIMLKALGYYRQYVVDSVFGTGTEDAVEDFQRDTPRLDIDGIVGPNTWGALEGALPVTPEEETPSPPILDSDLVCDGETWKRWEDLVHLVTSTPCRYGPGRGAFHKGKWIIRDKAGNYPRGGNLGYHAFVCSTWTNFVCGYLLRYNEDYTPEGGMPALSLVCEAPRDKLSPVPGLKNSYYRGYGDYLTKISPEIKDMTLGELYAQRKQLPTFVIAGQASRKRGWWNYHHCAVFVIDHRQQDSPIYRIAADGYRNKRGFSKTPMVYREIDQAYIHRHDLKHRLRCYAVTGIGSILTEPAHPAVLE